MKACSTIPSLFMLFILFIACETQCPPCPGEVADPSTVAASSEKEEPPIGAVLEEEELFSGKAKALKYRTITNWLTMTDGLVDGHNISMKYCQPDSMVFFVTEFRSGSAVDPSDTIQITTESGIRIETRIVEGVAQFKVATTNGSHFPDSRTNTHDVGGTRREDFDAKIANTQSPGGGVNPSPFFIGIDDARSEGICEMASIIGTLSAPGINPAIRVSYDSESREIKVSSNKSRPGPPNETWNQNDRRVPRWGTDFSVPNACRVPIKG